jgi:hypothetical protein
MGQKHEPIQTPVGILYGRDAIYLDLMAVDIKAKKVTLHGVINGNLCSIPQRSRFIKYTIAFVDVLALTMIELDSCDGEYSSSFDEVIHSSWVSELGGKVTSSHRHLVVHTYDDVFNVVCRQFELIIDKDVD